MLCSLSGRLLLPPSPTPEHLFMVTEHSVDALSMFGQELITRMFALSLMFTIAYITSSFLKCTYIGITRYVVHIKLST